MAQHLLIGMYRVYARSMLYQILLMLFFQYTTVMVFIKL